jgi:GAF domain-containing protein
MDGNPTRMRQFTGGLVRDVDSGIRVPGRAVVRMWGIVLPLVVLALVPLFGWRADQMWKVLVWEGVYLLYVVLLEMARYRLNRLYEGVPFRGFRVIANLVIITWLIAITRDAKLLLVPFYLIPIVASIHYFHKLWATGTTYLGAVLGLVVGGVWLSSVAPLSPQQVSIIAFIMLLITWQFRWAYRKSLLLEPVLKIAQDLRQTLDLDELLPQIVKAVLRVAGGDRALVLVVDPRTREFVDWAQQGFFLQEGLSIETAAAECTVLTASESFLHTHFTAIYGTQSIYARFFDVAPQSVLAEPIVSWGGKLLGVLSVTHDAPNRFDAQTQISARLLSHLIGYAVEACLAYRRGRLAEAAKTDISNALAHAGNDEEIGRRLVEMAQRTVPAAEECALHWIDGGTGQFALSKGTFSEADSMEKDVRRLSDVLTHHMSEAAGPVIVLEVGQHPWFSGSPPLLGLRSFVTAPIHREDTGVLLGILSVFSRAQDAFDDADKRNLEFLSDRASLALTRDMREAEANERATLLKQILAAALQLGTITDETTLHKQITAVARGVLGFRLARLRILDPATDELITVSADGVLEHDAQKLIGHRIPFQDLKPLLAPEFQVLRSYWIPEGHAVWSQIPRGHFYAGERRLFGPGWGPGNALFSLLGTESSKPLGLLSVDAPVSGHKPPSHVLDALGVLAMAAAWAIERLRDLQRLAEQQSRTRVFLQSVSQGLARSRDLRAIGEIAVGAGSELVGAEGCSLYIASADLLELTHSSHLAGTRYIGRRKPINDAPGSGLAAYVAATGETLRFRDGEHQLHPAWAHDEDHFSYLTSHECRSLLLVPVLAGEGKIMGVLHLENKTGAKADQGFDRDDEEMLRFLADQVASAMEKVSYHEAAERWEREGLEDDLHELINLYHSGVVLPLEVVQEWLRRGATDRAASMLPELVHRARTGLTELKSIHTAVHSRYLEEEDLEKALRRIVDTWKYMTGYSSAIRLEVDQVIRLLPRVKNAFLKIASAAIGNAILHSGVREHACGQIWVCLTRHQAGVLLEVGDNGSGIAPTIPDGFGIGRMRQLARECGSELQIKSTPDHGTQVTVHATVEGVGI